jgi:hypothetical protein
MNDRERLEAIVKVVRQYLPPDGICIREAMGEIIKLVDPMDEDQYWGKLSEEHLQALKKDMRAKAEKYVPDLPTHNSNLRKAAEQALEALQDTCDYLPSRSGVEREVDDAITALQVATCKQEAERERTAVIETIDELMGMESDRHPMFSEGYDHALDHIKQFVQGRGKK